jgi:hypothetical protein
MGKTLGSILTIVAAIAVNVIPGVGQFLSATIGISATAATSIIAGITVMGIQSALSLLGLGPKGPKPETTEQTIKTSRPPRVSAYGRSRLYGALIEYETSSGGTAIDVLAIHEGKIDAVEKVYLQDEEVTLTGSTVNAGADGRWKNGAIKVYWTDGSTPGAGLPAVEALIPEWNDGNHRGDGVMLGALTAKAVAQKEFQETYPHGAPPGLSFACRWQLCPDPAAVDPLDESLWTWTENPVRQVLHYKLVREGPQSLLPYTDPGYEADLLALRQAWWARKIAPTLSYWTDAIALCDSAAPLKAGGTEALYRSEFSHKHIDDHRGVMSALLSTFDGWLTERSDGALVIYAGQYIEPDPADEIGPDEIVSYSWEGGQVDDGVAVNEVICSYISEDHAFNSVETTPWRNEADISRRGKLLSVDLSLPVPSHRQVRYLAKRSIIRALEPRRGTVTTNIAGRKIKGKRYIPLTLEEAGTVFFTGPVEIVRARRAFMGGITFDWIAADPNMDDWDPEIDEGDPAANGERVPSLPLDAPEIDSSELYVTDESASGSAGARIDIFLDAPVRDDLTWYVRWRVQGTTAWNEAEYPDIDAGPPIQIRTGFVPVNATVEFEVQYQVGDGRFSPWSATATISTEAVTLTDEDLEVLTDEDLVVVVDV